MSTRTRLQSIEHAAREEIVTKLLWTVRQARPERQGDILRQRLETMDAATRRQVYEALTTAELELLCGTGAETYLQTMPDDQLKRIVEDTSGATAQREYRQWRKGR